MQTANTTVNTRPETLRAIDSELAYYTGTENYYRYKMPFTPFDFKYTDGVQYVADKYASYWLLDVVFSHVADLYKKSERNRELLVCRLAVGNNNAAVFQVSDGNENILATQEIEYTDFPAQLHTIWVQDGVAMLPSEY